MVTSENRPICWGYNTRIVQLPKNLPCSGYFGKVKRIKSFCCGYCCLGIVMLLLSLVLYGTGGKVACCESSLCLHEAFVLVFLFWVKVIFLIKISISEIFVMMNQILGSDLKHGLGLKRGLRKTFGQQRREGGRFLVCQHIPLTLLLVVCQQISILFSAAHFSCYYDDDRSTTFQEMGMRHSFAICSSR